MVQAIPIILAVGASAASVVANKGKNKPLPPPNDADAELIAAKRQAKIQSGRENFLERQGTLGPIQLQAPTLKI